MPIVKILAGDEDITNLYFKGNFLSYSFFNQNLIVMNETLKSKKLSKIIEEDRLINYIYESGTSVWMKCNGHVHRTDGPAKIAVNSACQWWIDDENITDLMSSLLSKTSFNEDVHLGILAEYFAERGDFRLLDIVQPFLAE